MVRTSVFTGRLSDQSNATRSVNTHVQTDGRVIDQNVELEFRSVTLKSVTLRHVSPALGLFSRSVLLALFVIIVIIHFHHSSAKNCN